MIDLYGTGSPNVLKIIFMLEEIEREYDIIPISMAHGENYEPAFVTLNPLAKMPVIIDHDGAGADQPIFESGAILIYLAEAYAPHLFPASGHARWETLKWLMVQVSYAGPMLGQLNHFQLVPSQMEGYAFDRYRDQAKLIYGILDDRLKAMPWLGGESLSIADIAMYPWAAYLERHGFDPTNYPNFIAWREKLDERPSVKRAVKVTQELNSSMAAKAAPTDQQLDRMFGRSRPGPRADFERYSALGPMTTAKV